MNNLGVDAVPYEIISKVRDEVKSKKEFNDGIEILFKGSSEFDRYKEFFIPRKPDEPLDLYNYRLFLSSYDNLLSQCTGSLLNKFTDVSYTVEGLPEGETISSKLWNRIRKSLDGNGLNEREFFQRLLLELIKFGRVGIVYSLTGNPTGNLRDDFLSGVQPKIKIYSSPNIIDYGLDDKGNYDYVKIESLVTKNNPLSSDQIFANWEIYTKDSYMRFEVEVEKNEVGCYVPKTTQKTITEARIGLINVECVESYLHGFPSIPVQIIEVDETKHLAHKAYSVEKSRILISNHTNFASVTVGGQIQRVIKPLEGVDDIEGFGGDDFGLHTVIQADSYKMVETSGSSIKVLQEREQALSDIVRDLFYNSSISNSRHRVSQESGKAKQLDFAPLQDYLTTMGLICCETLENIYRYFSQILGDNVKESINITGLNQFLLESADSYIEKLVLLGGNWDNLPNSLKVEFLEDTARKLAPNASVDTQNRIVEEIKVGIGDNIVGKLNPLRKTLSTT